LSKNNDAVGKNLRQITSFARDMTRITLNDTTGYTIENMTFGPLLGRQEGKQSRMFNFSLQAQGSGYTI
jgi:hypothetical protein